MPIDRGNTLRKPYGNINESKGKFLELLEFCYDVLAGIERPQQFQDEKWNSCPTKLVDNAILYTDL